MKCGKQFEGEGFVCPQCLAEQAPAAAPENPIQPAPQPVYAPVEQPAPQPVYIPVEQPAPQPVYIPVEQPVPQAYAEAQPTQAPGFTLGSAQAVPKKKKKKLGLIIGLVLAALALVAGGVVLALNWNNWFGKDSKTAAPEDPAEHFAFLQEPQMQGVSDKIQSVYGSIMQATGTQAGAAAQSGMQDITLKLQVSEDILSAMGMALSQQGMDMDLTWLKELSLNFYGNTDPNGKAAQALVSLWVGKEKIISLDTVLELEDLVLYLAAPELNGQYLKLDLMKALADAGIDPSTVPVEQALELQQQWAEDMPSQEAVGQLTAGLMEIGLKYLTEDVQRDTQPLTVGECEKEVTVLTATITEKKLAQMLGEMLTFLKDNEAARQAVTATVQYIVDYADLMQLELATNSLTLDAYEAFLEEGVEAMEELAAEARKGNAIYVDVYADGDKTVGCHIIARNYEDEERHLLTVANLTEDNVSYFEANLADMAYITGEGTLAKGKLSGEYVLQVQGDPYLTLELKGVDTTTGYGSYILSPEAPLLELMELDSMVSTIASTVALQLDTAADGGCLSVLAGKTVLLSIDLRYSMGPGEAVTIPSDCVDVMDPDKTKAWLENVDFSGVLNNLKAAGLPKDLQSILEEAADQAMKTITQGDVAQELVGTWQATVKLSEMADQLGDLGEMEGYLDLEATTLVLCANFGQDGSYVLSVQKDSMRAMVMDMMNAMLESMMDQYGYSKEQLLGLLQVSSVEELVTEETLEEMMEGLQYDGVYTYENGVLTIDGVEQEFTLNGDNLELAYDGVMLTFQRQ